MATFNIAEKQNYQTDIDALKKILDNPGTTLPDVLTAPFCYQAMKKKFQPLID